MHSDQFIIETLADLTRAIVGALEPDHATDRLDAIARELQLVASRSNPFNKLLSGVADDINGSPLPPRKPSDVG